jgi:AraC family transcriptional regulator of adaptative response/methylated-DNA-[protein]-cysteine methyltransferase
MVMYISEIRNTNMLDEEQCWQDVLARNAQANGTFVIAVRSTGVYCRPSCPARHPRREQVVFFRHPQEASAAGFRPCKRCQPDQDDLSEPQTELVEQICRYIEMHLDTPLRLADLSQQFYLSQYHLQRTFKRIKGVTPRQYAEACRLAEFKTRLHDGEAVTSALYNAGYQSSSSLYDHAAEQLGMTPAAYRQGGKGTRMSYTIFASTLGNVLVASTERGVSAVRFGDDEASMEAALLREFPQAQLARDDDNLRPWAALFQQHLQGLLSASSLSSIPLDVQATTFQWKVWNALRRIPAGQTCSYQAIAEAIGQPTASRAVAHACATNPVAVFIPCHRVVHRNGDIGGYRWGEDRKRVLLSLEKTSDAPTLVHE